MLHGRIRQLDRWDLVWKHALAIVGRSHYRENATETILDKNHGSEKNFLTADEYRFGT